MSFYINTHFLFTEQSAQLNNAVWLHLKDYFVVSSEWKK